MTACLLVQGRISDEEQYGRDRQAVMLLIERYGGKHVRSGAVELLEGRQDDRVTLRHRDDTAMRGWGLHPLAAAG